MRAIRRRDTQPELALRRLLHASGLRYRVDRRLDLGAVKPRPDVSLGRARVAVFVDGCFWHGCPEHSKPPSTNGGYWTPKLDANMRRDRAQNLALENAGWLVIRVWEHEDPVDAAARILRAVRDRLA
jgi:DNA mismatch endonuclease, patch repair protein